MTVDEAAGNPRVVAAIAARTDHVDHRTVIKCLRGESPFSKIWVQVEGAARDLGVIDFPDPAPRKPRRPRTCQGCAAKDAEIARLRERVSSIGRAKAEALASLGILESAEANVAALRARVAELEAEVEGVTAVAGTDAHETPDQAPKTAVAAITGLAHSRLGPPVPEPIDTPPAKAAPKPRQGCHVTLELDGQDLLAVG